MLASLVAALACVITPPPAHAAGASVDVNVMSLPVESGPLSSPPVDAALLWSPAPEPRNALASRDSLALRELVTPLEVDCVGATLPMVDCSALASRLEDARDLGSCHLLAPARGRTAILARGRTRAGSHHVAVGSVTPAPDLLIPDSHATPILWPARLAFTPSLVASRLRAPPPGTPPTPPSRRIDRPPRS